MDALDGGRGARQRGRGREPPRLRRRAPRVPSLTATAQGRGAPSSRAATATRREPGQPSRPRCCAPTSGVYPFGWLGILSEVPPVSARAHLRHHDRASRSAHAPRHAEPLLRAVRGGRQRRQVVRHRFWDELAARLAPAAAHRTGPVDQIGITPLRSFVAEPLRFGRLFLAGDAGPIVPPTGAKGLNLAVSDVQYLAARCWSRSPAPHGLTYSPPPWRGCGGRQASRGSSPRQHRFPDPAPTPAAGGRARLPGRLRGGATQASPGAQHEPALSEIGTSTHPRRQVEGWRRDQGVAARVVDEDAVAGGRGRGRSRPAGRAGRRRRACGARWGGASRCPTAPGRERRR